MPIGAIWDDIWDEGIWDDIWAAEEVEAPSDTTPDPFTFGVRVNVPLEAVVVSAPVIITGIDAPAAITISDGEYRINGGDWDDQAGTVEAGDVVEVRHTASNSHSTATVTTVTIGGVEGTFTSVTISEAGAVQVGDWVRHSRRVFEGGAWRRRF